MALGVPILKHFRVSQDRLPLRSIGILSSFWAIFTKGNNIGDLLCAFLGNETFRKLGLLLTLKALNKNCSRRHFNFLLLSFEENKA